MSADVYLKIYSKIASKSTENLLKQTLCTEFDYSTKNGFHAYIEMKKDR